MSNTRAGIRRIASAFNSWIKYGRNGNESAPLDADFRELINIAERLLRERDALKKRLKTIRTEASVTTAELDNFTGGDDRQWLARFAADIEALCEM